MVLLRSTLNSPSLSANWNLLPRLMSYSTVLEAYTLTEILELNDLSEEDALEFMVEEGFISLPKISPLDFDD